MWAGDDAVITGPAAAAWAGYLNNLSPANPIGVLVPPNRRMSSQLLIRVVRARIDERDTTSSDGILITSACRSAVDLAAQGCNDLLVRGCRRADLVSRLGGDEFVILCPEVHDAAELLEIGDRITAVIAEPLQLAGRWLTVHTSIGMRLATGEENADGVLRVADAAMYAAKRLGSGHRVLFDKGAGLTGLDRPGLEEELREGVDRGQVQAAFQPVINLGGGAYAGAEALARWQHPTRGLIVASQFIAVAEEADVAAELDRDHRRRPRPRRSSGCPPV